MRLLACGALLVVATVSHGQTRQVSARDLTVRLFSTQPVMSASVDAKNATMKLCSTCEEALVPPQLQIRTTAGGALKMHVGARSTSHMMFAGELRMTTADGRSASGAGKWVVKRGSDGLHILLTVPSEQYVMAVLQSEAGVNDGSEALKALAVVARSFALTHPGRHGAEGLCDSTHCQALRMAPVPQRIRDAVQATAGETLWFGRKQVDGYFTQNCGGQTEDASELWGGEREPWLRSHADPYCQRDPSQWHASVSREELLRSLDQEGFRAPGDFDAVRITARDSSGRAAKLEVSGHGQTLVLSAAALRFAMNRELGWNRIRSDWYSMRMTGNSIIFDGRGYGHGVGLCQAGAAEMAREEKGYREILAFYFPGAQVRIGSGDEGWRTQEEHGWTLRSTGIHAEAAQAGDVAWIAAKARWGSPEAVHPVVTTAPDTELFRQLTNEPGWALAATSGERVTLQPIPIVKAHGSVETLMLHEFLHTLVEAESEFSTPLWLREGLVEVLAGEKSGSSSMTSNQVEQALQRARSLTEAQQAHRAAAALVRKLVSKYGLQIVRGWLRGGVPAGILMS